MSSTITCPHCHQPIEISQALTHQVEEQVLAAERLKFKQSQEQADKKHQQELLELQKKSQAESAQKLKALEQESFTKAQEKFEFELKKLREANEASSERKAKLEEELLSVTKQIRQLQEQDHQRKLDMEKQLLEAQAKIRDEAKKQADDETHLLIQQLKNQIADAQKANEDMKRRLEQGSQQSQGEIFELIIEDILRREFPGDEIKEVPKGVRGADVIHVVRSSSETVGSIIWELKNTKAFSPSWLPKLREDQRSVNAEVAILVSTVLPDGIKGFKMIDGVFVCHTNFILDIADLIRRQLLAVARIKQNTQGQKDKAAILFEYLTGTEFTHRMESIVEAFTGMQEEIEKEKRYFAQKWARDEKRLRAVIDQSHGVYGDLQGIVGKQLTTPKQLQIEE